MKFFDFTQLFEQIMRFAAQKPVTVVIDEFQEFLKVNPSVFSGIQKIWDLYKGNAKINLVVSGSVYTLMQKIFKTKRAALYGRETAFLKIDPFRVSVLKQILCEYSPGFSNEDLLALWSFTGGVAKYVEMLVDGRHPDGLYHSQARAYPLDQPDHRYAAGHRSGHGGHVGHYNKAAGKAAVVSW